MVQQMQTEAVVDVSPAGSEALIRAVAHPRFEIVPMKGVEDQAAHLPPGAKVTVTCSPTGGIDKTLLLAAHLAAQGFEVVPHIAARLVVDRAHLRDLLQELAAFDVRDVFVIGGDAREPVGAFASALDLLQAMADLGHELDAIGVGAYPEHHPLIDQEALRRALWGKQRFATYMVTQICFQPETILRWLAEMREEGIELPVYIGIPGVVDARRLLRISMKIGVGDSMRYLAKHANLAARLLLPGGYNPDHLVEELARYVGDSECKIRGLHINTFNQVEATEKWRRSLVRSYLSPAR